MADRSSSLLDEDDMKRRVVAVEGQAAAAAAVRIVCVLGLGLAGWNKNNQGKRGPTL